MSAREFKPGDVVLTAQGKLALRRYNAPHQWIDSQGAPWSDDRFPTNVRPLLVIDPEDCEQVRRLAIEYAAQGRRLGYSTPLTQQGDRESAMQRALRSLSTPPKPEEPKGLGAVVEDAEGRRWVRIAIGKYGWVLANTMSQFGEDFDGSLWAEFDAVRVLSEGVIADA